MRTTDVARTFRQWKAEVASALMAIGRGEDRDADFDAERARLLEKIGQGRRIWAARMIADIASFCARWGIDPDAIPMPTPEEVNEWMRGGR
ncbi:MAG: hypothetical protein RXR82_00325 [Nitrososphaeria archaeon]